MRGRTCRNHCATCGRHFTSLGAFDIHRTGPQSDRRCEEPDMRFEGGSGICRVYLAESVGTIWGLIADRRAAVAIQANFRREASRQRRVTPHERLCG